MQGRIQGQAKKSQSEFIQRDTYSIGRKQTISESESSPRAWGCWSLWAKEFLTLMSRRNILVISGKGRDFPGTGPLPTFWPFMVHLRTDMVVKGSDSLVL